VRRLLTPWKLAIAALAVLAATTGLLFALPDQGSYLFLPDEPHSVAPLVMVEDGKPADDKGGLYFVDVVVRQPSIGERLLAGLFYDGVSLVPADAVNPTGLSEQQRRQASLEVMTRSQQVAAAVALRAAGYKVGAKNDGVFVAQVLPGTPAAGKLHPADLIVELDGTPIDSLARLRSVLDARKPGDEIELVVRRGKQRRGLSVELAADPDDPSRGVIGVLVEQSVDVRLPLQVEIDAGNVGGPSAGLAFALGVLEKLGRDVDHGLRVAVTGEIELDGSVRPVGGIKQKTIGAKDAGIQLFLVPAGDNAQEARRYADGMRVVPVQSFQQALRALATAPAAHQN
jgi:PDZ domain-containing protein